VTLYGQWTGSCSDGLPLTSIVYLLIIVYVQWALGLCCSWWHDEFEFCLGVFGVFSCFVLGVVHRWCLIDAINVVKNTDIRPLVYAVGAVCVICYCRGSERRRRDCVTFCGKQLLAESRFAGYFDVSAGREAPRWVGWTGLDGRASPLRLLLTGNWQQTKRKMHIGKKRQRYFRAMLMIIKHK